MTPYSTLIFTCVISAMVVGAIIIGVSLMDSPSDARSKNLDLRRIAELQRLSWAINGYQHIHNTLPKNIAELQTTHASNDPVSGQLYEYKVVSADAYQLCAVFDSVPDKAQENTIYNNCAPDWQKHDKGKSCYDISIKPCK